MSDRSNSSAKLKKNVILIDSSSLFDYPSIERFFDDTADLEPEVRIPVAADSDLRVIGDYDEYKKTRDFLRKKLMDRRFNYIGSLGESSADTIIKYCMLRRMKVQLAVITQDKRLIHDITVINTFQSSVGREIPIYHFTFGDNREEQTKRNRLFCNKIDKL